MGRIFCYSFMSANVWFLAICKHFFASYTLHKHVTFAVLCFYAHEQTTVLFIYRLFVWHQNLCGVYLHSLFLIVPCRGYIKVVEPIFWYLPLPTPPVPPTSSNPKPYPNPNFWFSKKFFSKNILLLKSRFEIVKIDDFSWFIGKIYFTLRRKRCWIAKFTFI